MGVCVSVRLSVRKPDPFAHLPKRHTRLQPSHLVGRAFPVCRVAPLVRLSVSLSPVCQIQQRSSHSSLIMTWHAKRVGWWWQRKDEREGGRGAGGVFSLQQALFSPRSPGHHTPAGTHLIMHPVWRGGQNGTPKSIV